MLAAGRQTDTQAQSALEELCRTYWFPLYAYVRRQTNNREDAEDLTQAFFARFLQRNYLAGLDSERGRFRAYLLAALKHFLTNERDKTRRDKRGGGAPHLSLDWHTADAQFQVAANNQLSPDEAFDREWAVALLNQVINRLRAECIANGTATQFDHLKAFLSTDHGKASYADVARNLGQNETAVRVAVHRLRKRYRQLLRTEIANTLADAHQVQEELRALFSAFGS